LEDIEHFRNLGGFHFLGSGRTKIETDEQLRSSMQNCIDLNLDGLVVIGGDDSNTNAAILAEYFLTNNCKTKVIGCPKTIDGDLRNEDIEASFGFDTATKEFAGLGEIFFFFHRNYTRCYSRYCLFLVKWRTSASTRSAR
jgi:6-phosphofructokinase